MDAKTIKGHMAILEKTKNDKEILETLNVLKKSIKPTEKLLRETKVGVVVNKFRSYQNEEIATLVKKIIKYWKDEVSKEKKQRLNTSSDKSASPTTPISTPASATSGSTTTLQKKFVSQGPRSFTNDGVKVDLYENRVRNNVVGALYNGLCIDSEHPPSAVLKNAKDIESELFSKEKLDTGRAYVNRARSLASNLRQKNNPELRQRINNGDISPVDFVTMDPKDMAPEHLKKQLEDIKKQNLFNAQGATQERAVTDRFTCGKCKEKKVSYYQLQTRSADEPLTTFCTCENCGNRWKFS